MLLLLFINNC